MSREARLAAFQRVRISPKPRVLFVTHGHGGGVRRHVEELAGSIANDAEVLLLSPHGDRVQLRGLGAGESMALWIDPRADWQRLVQLLQAVGIDRVHIHHVHGLPREVLDLPRALGCAHDVTLHDHFPACPQYHMLAGDGRFCGGDPSCGKCLDLQPAQWPVSIDEWRSMFGGLLERADRVIAPSQDTAARIRRHFPRCSPVAWPHPQAPSKAPGRALRVLVPGAISTAKGLALLADCARDAAARSLALHFHVVGYIAFPPPPLWPEVPLTIGGEYREGELPRLLAAAGGDVVFFPVQVAETFSFTLSDALDTALPIVATDLGCLPERLAGHPGARIVPWDMPAAAINDVLMALRTPSPSRPAPRVSFDDYRARYLKGLRRTAAGRPHAALPIDPAWLEAPVTRGPPPPAALAFLFEDAFRCGRALSRDELEAGIREAAQRAAPPKS